MYTREDLLMKLIGSVCMALLLTAAAHAQTQQEIQSQQPKKVEGHPNPKLAVLVTVDPPASYQCTDGYDLYVERLKPTDSKDPETSFRGFYYIGLPVPGNANLGLATSRPGAELRSICLKSK